MERRKVVMCCVLSLLGLLSAVTAFAAEATRVKRSQVKVTTETNSIKKCSYPRSPAYDLGFTSAFSLMMAHMIVTFCYRKGPSISLICFVFSWFTFVIALLVLFTGASFNDEHTEDSTDFVGPYFCYIVKPGVFSIGAVLSLVTTALEIVYYLSLSSTSKHDVAATMTPANQGAGIAMGQAQIPERVEDPVFVHEGTYTRRQFT
ncbi:PREDICTED: uncharacterized protein LOC104735753 [Camelina sativa]|uniref:Uncharacterized protein LOC104735753 n=1 Tax=Camelina sativa TaxID=90675 RepID=A0ABM0VBX4_CAMSA|nr:PREDICTED: uncharacterized protein LOC104735753 [Camelina sativa]